jgi:MFS transporter, SHS family, sialic acid transporter
MGESKTLSRGQWFALAAAFLGWMFDGVVLGLLPLVSRPALKDLLNINDDARVGLLHGRLVACFLVGAACGGLLFGWLGDKVGRVRAMIFSILAYSLFTGCGYFATQPWHLGLFFFLAALGLGGQWSLGVALVMECWPEKFRPMLAGVIGAASNVGFLMIAVVGVCFPVTPHSWRWLMLVGASPAVLALFIALFVPESERWKAAAKRVGRSPIVEIFRPALLRKTLLGIAFASIPLISTWAAVSGWMPMWMDSLAELAGDHSGHAKALTQVVISIGAILGCLVAPVVGGRLGRRPVYFGLCALSLLGCQCVFRLFDSYSVTLLLLAGVVGAFTAAFYGWMPLYLPELFPTRVRATGQGLSFNFGRIVAAVGALYMGELTHSLKGQFGPAMATVTLIYVLGMVLIWFAPETKGKPLPD